MLTFIIRLCILSVSFLSLISNYLIICSFKSRLLLYYRPSLHYGYSISFLLSRWKGRVFSWVILEVPFIGVLFGALNVDFLVGYVFKYH